MEFSGLIVKNTFLSLPAHENFPCRRSNSAPRAWKPCSAGAFFPCVSTRERFEDCRSEVDSNDDFEDCLSEDGTNALGKRLSDQGSEKKCEISKSVKTDCPGDTTDESLADTADDWPSDSWSFANTEDSFSVAGLDDAFEELSRQQSMPDVCSNTSVSDQGSCCTGKVTLNLFDSVCPDSLVQGERHCSSRLRAKAMPFTSIAESQVRSIIAGTVQVLQESLEVKDVKVNDGGMGGTTLIMADSRNSCPDAGFVFAEVQDSLLRMAEQSESTYVLGYGAHPFQTLDDLSFSTTIAVLPEAHKKTACWDVYEKGFCPRSRCGTCRWDHPSTADTMKLVVMMTSSIAD